MTALHNVVRECRAVLELTDDSSRADQLTAHCPLTAKEAGRNNKSRKIRMHRAASPGILPNAERENKFSEPRVGRAHAEAKRTLKRKADHDSTA